MNAAFRLSVWLPLLAALASAAGLFAPGFYRDSPYLKTLWRGNDAVTLFVIVPALILSLWAYRRGSLRGLLLWMGLLLYLAYNYAFYLFAAAFNAAFPLYAALLSVSGFALVFGLSALPVRQLAFSTRRRGWIVAYLILIAAVLCGVEIPPIIRFLSDGTVPPLVEQTDHPTSVVYALDLTTVVPLSLLAAVWLWRNEKWGYILAVLMLVKGGTYGLVLTANSLILKLTHTGEDLLLPFYLFVMLGGLAGLIWLLRPARAAPA